MYNLYAIQQYLRNPHPSTFSFFINFYMHKAQVNHFPSDICCYLKFSYLCSEVVKRGSEGGLSLSTKSRHLPLRKQFHHDSSGKRTSSLCETAFFMRHLSL